MSPTSRTPQRRQTDALLTTTRSVRRRLDLVRPVDDEVLRECLTIALQAPNGSNRQTWHWIVVTDPGLKAEVAAVYHEAYATLRPPGSSRSSMRDDASARIDGSVEWLVDNLGAVPALVVACVEPYLPDREDGADFASSTLYGSIYPAVWNLQLALASRGLGSCPTTVLLMKADRLRNVLGIPASHIPACMLPVAHISSGPPFGPAPRRPVDEVVTWNGWNAAATG